MKIAKMLKILFMVLGLLVWSAPIVNGAQYLTVNGQDVTSISLELGQSRTVEVVSTDSTSYVDYVGFDNGIVLGAFTHLETKPEAGDLAAVVEYDQPAFYGYYVNATGISPAPSPGVHFVFEYTPQQGGETDLKLYDSTFTSVIDSVHITVIPLQPLPMTTAFTYQGRLMDSISPANGLYDFEFKLYDNPDPVFAARQGNTIDINDLDVIEGYFTAELNFGSDVFNGDARWLEIAVRPGDSNDPNDFITLSPRQELTPTPYALQTRGIFVDGAGNVGIGTDIPFERLDVDHGNLLVQGIGSFDTDGEEGFVYLGNTYHYIKSEWGLGVSIGTWGVDPALVIRNLTGNVGIGTTDPQKNLSVQATRPQIALAESGGDTGVVEFHEETNQLRLQYWSDYGATFMRDIMVLDGDTGRIGIGTTIPYSRLDIKAASGFSDGGLRITSSINDNQVITVQDAIPGDQGMISVKAGGSNKIVLKANGDTYFNGGNVGIGTTTPEKKLTIQSTRPQIALVESGGGAGVLEFHEQENQLRLQYWTDYGSTWDTTMMTLDGDTGRVGIGTTEPAALLNVVGQGEIGFSNATISGRNTSTALLGTYGVLGECDDSTYGFGVGGYSKYGYGVHGGSTYGYGVSGASGTNCGVYGKASEANDVTNYGGYFEAAGQLGRGVYAEALGVFAIGVEGHGQLFNFYASGPGQDYGSSSSIRWKSNIHEIDNPLDKVLQLRGVYFDWDAEHGGEHDVGMIAEEVGKVLPEIVQYEENGIDATGMDYSKLTPLLVEAVKALKKENDKLQKQNNQLESRLSALENLMRGSPLIRKEL